MQHILWSKEENYPITILIKSNAMYKNSIEEFYITPTKVHPKKFLVLDLYYQPTNKVTVANCKEWLTELQPSVEQLQTKLIVCADASYFKVLTGNTKTEHLFGQVVPCTFQGFEGVSCVLTYNYMSLKHNPNNLDRMALANKAVAGFITGNHFTIGKSVIRSARYPEGTEAIARELSDLHAYPALTVDIEGFSLKHYKCGIGTIAFAWNQHEGISFTVDYVPCEPYEGEYWCTEDKVFKTTTMYGKYVPQPELYKLLRTFFETYKGTLIYHNGLFDVRVLIYVLWMQHLDDQRGLQQGLEIMCPFEDTKIVSYLATNSCAGNKLSLKDQAYEFLGNYGVL